MQKRNLRVGAIGCGHIFNLAHVYAYTEIENVDLVGFYDIDPKRAEETKENYARVLEKLIKERTPIPKIYQWSNPFFSQEDISEQFQRNIRELVVYREPEELLKDVDIVDICTPPKWHMTYAIKALLKDVNAMTEKPMSRSWWEARKIKPILTKSKAIYQLNDDNVFHPRFQIIKNSVEDGAIGDVKHVTLYRGSNGPERNSWFWNPEISGGGSLMDYGTHAVTMSWYLIGFDKKPVKVKSDFIKSGYRHRLIEGRLQTIQVEDDAHVRVLFEDHKNGEWIDASIEATWSRPLVGLGSDDSSYVKIEGTEGTVVAYRDKKGVDVVRIRKTGFGDRIVPVPKVEHERDSIRNEIRSFTESVRNGQRSICNEDIGIGTLEILGAAYLSEVRARRSVLLSEFRDFCETYAQKYPDEEVSSRIIEYLMSPYRSSIE